VPTVGSFLLIGAVAATVTFVTTPLVGRLARRQGWVYLPNDRTVHQSPLPDVGGLAMFAGFLAAMFTAWLTDAFDVLFANNSEPLGVVIAASIVFGVGFIDDIREVSAPAKVAGTVLAGIVLVQSVSSCSRSGCPSSTVRSCWQIWRRSSRCSGSSA
jgi:UDP-GlcNAc:undecaprenyl-phosphate/decaprenyl-phosphate GlcNAc-1-phosphate transferase